MVAKLSMLSECQNLYVFYGEDIGIDFLGYVLRPHYRVLRTKTKQRMFKKMGQRVGAYNHEEIGEYALEQTLQSYLGMLDHCSGYGIEKQLKNEIWFRKETRNDKNRDVVLESDGKAVRRK